VFPESDSGVVRYPYRMRGWLVTLIVETFPLAAYLFYVESFSATFAQLTGRGSGIIALGAEIIHLVTRADLDQCTSITFTLLAISFAMFPLLTLITYVHARLAGTILSLAPSGVAVSRGLWRDAFEADYRDIQDVKTIKNRYFRILRLSLKGGNFWDIQSRDLPSGAAFDAVAKAVEAHVAKGNFDADAGPFAEPQQA